MTKCSRLSLGPLRKATKDRRVCRPMLPQIWPRETSQCRGPRNVPESSRRAESEHGTPGPWPAPGPEECRRSRQPGRRGQSAFPGVPRRSQPCPHPKLAQ